jgi:hypothetical protein
MPIFATRSKALLVAMETRSSNSLDRKTLICLSLGTELRGAGEIVAQVISITFQQHQLHITMGTANGMHPTILSVLKVRSGLHSNMPQTHTK